MNLGSIWAEMGLDIRKLDKGLRDASAKLVAADKQINTMGASLTRNSTKFMAAGGIMVAAAGAAGTAVVKMASEFETSMRNVNSIMQVSEDELADISAEVLDISKKLPQSATTLANGLYDIASSGFAGAEGLKVLEASARAAAAGMTTTEVSAKGVTAVLNAYGYSADEANRISDTMFRTVDKGVVSFEELSSNIGEVVGTSNLAKIGFEEVSGALGYITTKGYSAAEATTALNRLMLGIIDPSAELAAVLHNAGYESGEFALQQVGLMGVLELMDAKANGSMAELKALAGDIRAAKAAGALLGNGIESLTEYMADFEDTTGATNLALEEQSKSLSYQIDLLKSSLSAVGITLGQEFIPQVTGTVQEMTKFVDANAETIVGLGTLGIKATAVVGGILLLTGALGKLRAMVIGHPVGALLAAYAGVGTVISSFASDIENDYVRSLVMGANAISATKEAVEVFGKAHAVAEENNESFIKTLFRTRKAVEEEYDALVQAEEQANELAISSVEWINKYSDALPNAANEMAKLTNLFNGGNLSAEAFTIGIENLRKETNNGRDDIENINKSLGDLTSTTVLSEDKIKMRTAAEKAAADTTRYNTEMIEANTMSVEEQLAALDEWIAKLFGLTNAEGSYQEAVWATEDALKAYTEAVAEHGEESREAEQAAINLDRARQAELARLAELYQADGTSIERKQELRNELVKLLKQTEETSGLSQKEFLEMAEVFGLTSGEIIVLAGNMGIELDEATKDRLIKVAIEGVEEVLKGAADVKKMIESIPSSVSTRMAVNIVRQEQLGALGGMVTGTGIRRYAAGGMIGAAAGTVVPQTGREVPILAHEGEMILNTSQQNNLIDALWGVANGKGFSTGSNDQPIYVNVVAELDGQVIYEKTSQHIYRQTGTARAGKGIR